MLNHNTFRIVFFVAISIASFLFLKQGVQSGIRFEHFDKVAHFIVFAGLAFLYHQSFQQPIRGKIAVLSIYGFVIELIQAFLPYRTASYADWIADIAGVLCFFAINEFIIKRYLQGSKK
jgi:VanZ family protein